MRAWVVFDREGRPMVINEEQHTAISDTEEIFYLPWEGLEGYGYTCQLCIVHPIPAEQLEREEER